MHLRSVVVAVGTAVALTSAPANALAQTGPSAPGGAGTSVMSGAATRDYGTPTKAPGKVCPFTGNVPVEIPLGALPYGSSLPGTGGITLPGPSVPSSIYSELCMTAKSLKQTKAGHPPAILVLVHGITYGTWYWDLPYRPETYSAVNYLTRHGYATLNIDRLGEGRSDHPPSALVTSATNSEVLHQIVQKLKSGGIGGITFPHIGLVGHSYGTITAWGETQRYNDVDVTIGTGYSDGINGLTAGAFIAAAGPASASPYYAGESWAADPGYLQPTPGTRDFPQLYNTKVADPAVIALDEKLANTVTVAEASTFTQNEYDGTRKNIVTPTFLINGERDIMVCGSDAEMCATDAGTSATPAELETAASKMTAWQKASMNTAACFRGAVVPEAAHDISLHPNAHQLNATIAYFADQAMGVNGENVESYRKSCADPASALDLVPTPMMPGVSPPPADGIPPVLPARRAARRLG